MESNSAKVFVQLPALPSPDTHIRLLTLLPADALATAEEKRTSPILCDISVAPIDGPSRPGFKALSYTWGTGERDRAIYFGDAALLVTSSLDEALRSLRQDDVPVILWVDQLCINQQDDREKSHQVGLMSKVYALADEVIVWLGPAADESDAVMDLWATAGQEGVDWGYENYSISDGHARLIAALFGQDHLTDPDFVELLERTWSRAAPLAEAINKWLQRSWFRRVWIVQEFALNARVVFACGAKKRVEADLVKVATLLCRWCYVKYGVGNTSSHKILADNPTSGLFNIRTKKRRLDDGTGPGQTLYEIMRELYVELEMQSTDPRDRVYAVLGLVSDREAVAIVPNYEDNDVEHVFTTTARALINGGGGTETLCWSQHPRINPGLPTWVPEWSKIRPSFYNIYSTDKHKFAAGRDSKLAMVPAGDDRVLGLRGFCIDVIEEAGSAWNGNHLGWASYASFASLLAEVISLCLISQSRNQPIYASDERRTEAMWRVPIGDIHFFEQGRDGRRAAPDTARAHAAALETCALHGRAKAAGVFDAKAPHFKAAYDASERYFVSMKMMYGKRPFVTAKGLRPHPTAKMSQILDRTINNLRQSFEDITLHKFIRLVIIVGAYILLRPYLMKATGSSQMDQHEAEFDDPNAPKAKISPNTLRGQVDIPEDTDDEDEADGTGADWGKKARRRQRAVIKQLLDAEEDRLAKLQEDEEDKDIEEFLQK
ncbi:trafficking PGA2-domain-containing protein [Plectosphaerella plurivora]|uniref:Trafficking PGA2-domain-containing protein n=1 Tax=Plectosphaerella plurivora TaxID=936078 RepID=A0A9P8VGN7_9PEZI|nr:trafficking PGA2-domain-containing protein [Plectosphaerella plurivora]